MSFSLFSSLTFNWDNAASSELFVSRPTSLGWRVGTELKLMVMTLSLSESSWRDVKTSRPPPVRRARKEIQTKKGPLLDWERTCEAEDPNVFYIEPIDRGMKQISIFIAHSESLQCVTCPPPHRHQDGQRAPGLRSNTRGLCAHLCGCLFCLCNRALCEVCVHVMDYTRVYVSMVCRDSRGVHIKKRKDACGHERVKGWHAVRA